VTLHAETSGRGPRLVLVHGFTQNRNCWGPLAADLERDHEVVRVDAPGHGRSAGVRADLGEGARLLAERGGPATYVGYSMGGRFVLRLAVDRPEVVRGVVVVGATAGLDDPQARAERSARDRELADGLERDGLDAFLDRWLAQPLFAGLPEPMRFLDERRDNTASGLADSLRRAGTGRQEPLWDRLAAVAAPVLAVAGQADAKFTAEARRLVAAVGAPAELALVPGAGHAAHLERPAEFLGALRPWLARHGL
jgi:2-succinyl-6-hydroxy-2,4-cyclohexadiene-1-carboxylate synthase